MIVNNLHTFRCARSPVETYSPLIVNSDAVLTLPVTCQSLKPVSRNHSDILQLFGVIQHSQLPPRHGLDIAELTAAPPVEQFLGFLAVEGPDHPANISRKALNGLRCVLASLREISVCTRMPHGGLYR